MRPLRTEDLNMILQNNPVTFGNYLGAYPACIFPKTNKKRYSWISNTHHHGKSGKHWVCWCIDGDKAIFFDSYGRQADDPTLPTYFKNHAKNFKNIYFSKRRVQGWDSVACGYFCIHFIYNFALGLDYKCFIEDYSRDFIKNDETVYNFVNLLS